ncbi:MAG: PAS domain S-box-containing protein [Marivirga sp.]|jgi:PAS domain S-box-containing protein
MSKNKVTDPNSQVQQFFELSIDLICVFDEHYKFEHVSSSSKTILGYSCGELIGTTIYEHLHTDDAAKTDQQGLGIKSGEEDTYFENRLYHKDGSTVYLEWTSKFNKQTKQFYAVARDLSTVKKKEKQQKIQDQINAAIINSTKDLVWSLDKNYLFTGFNKAFQNSRTELYDAKIEIGINTFESVAFTKEHTTLWKGYYNKVFSGQHFEFEYMVDGTFAKDGQAEWHRIEMSPIYVGSEVVGLVGKSRNITAAKVAAEILETLNESLRQKNEALEQFAYIASHDLQEPLRNVISFMDLLKSHFGQNLDETAASYIDYAADSSLRMKQIIVDLLDYAKADAAVQITEIDCNEIVNTSIELLKDQIKETKAIITVDKLPIIQFNQGAFRQLIMNLVGNGIKYVLPDQTPKIHISYQEDDTYFHFGIKDNGIGIDPQHQEDIFVVFKRLHNRNDYKGTGLGLAICKKIVDRFDGKISITSAAGVGSKFVFSVPKKLKST